MTRLLQELRAWGMGSAQSDDVTIVVLRRRLEHLSEELHSIVDDVLGLERATVFWEEVVVQLCEPSLANARVEDWNRILPEVARIAREQFGRGLARELNQQMRLAIEEYR
jgi:sigma-B regulation protein RsbU (phosphoserine phosphatase)